MMGVKATRFGAPAFGYARNNAPKEQKQPPLGHKPSDLLAIMPQKSKNNPSWGINPYFFEIVNSRGYKKVFIEC